MVILARCGCATKARAEFCQERFGQRPEPRVGKTAHALRDKIKIGLGRCTRRVITLE
jgi:hypothetical protein